MISEDYHCVSVSHLFGSPLSRSVFVYEWPRLSVTLTGCKVSLWVDSEVQVIAFVGIEWGDLRCGAQGVVVCKLADWEELVPVVLLVVAVDPDVLFQGLVSALSLPIIFQMVI